MLTCWIWCVEPSTVLALKCCQELCVLRVRRCRGLCRWAHKRQKNWRRPSAHHTLQITFNYCVPAVLSRQQSTASQCLPWLWSYLVTSNEKYRKASTNQSSIWWNKTEPLSLVYWRRLHYRSCWCPLLTSCLVASDSTKALCRLDKMGPRGRGGMSWCVEQFFGWTGVESDHKNLHGYFLTLISAQDSALKRKTCFRQGLESSQSFSLLFFKYAVLAFDL